MTSSVKPRKLRLISKAVAMNASALMHNLPCDGTIEVVVREYKKPSSHEQRKLMWGIRLAEIAEQAWVDGKQFSKETWHEYLKELYLPEGFIEGETLDGYQKWVELPNGQRHMIGSTTRLTTKGQCIYMEKVEAYSVVELGVRFSADERMEA